MDWLWIGMLVGIGLFIAPIIIQLVLVIVMGCGILLVSTIKAIFGK